MTDVSSSDEPDTTSDLPSDASYYSQQIILRIDEEDAGALYDGMALAHHGVSHAWHAAVTEVAEARFVKHAIDPGECRLSMLAAVPPRVHSCF